MPLCETPSALRGAYDCRERYHRSPLKEEVDISTIALHRDEYGSEHAIVIAPSFATTLGDKAGIAKQIDRYQIGKFGIGKLAAIVAPWLWKSVGRKIATFNAPASKELATNSSIALFGLA